MTTAMSTDRLRQRFSKWDLDGNGTLERHDLENEARRIAQAFGAAPNSPEARNIVEAFGGMFDYFAAQAGVAKTGSINEDQFIQVLQKLMFTDGGAGFNRVVRPPIQALVGLCDRNSDGMINKQEFAQWLKVLGVSQSDAATSFVKIDTNRDGELTVDELLAAIGDFSSGKLDIPLLG